MKRSLILLALIISAWLAPIPVLGNPPTPPPPLRPTMIVVTPIPSKTPFGPSATGGTPGAGKPTLAPPTKAPVETGGPVVSPAPRLQKPCRLYLPWIVTP